MALHGDVLSLVLHHAMGIPSNDAKMRRVCRAWRDSVPNPIGWLRDALPHGDPDCRRFVRWVLASRRHTAPVYDFANHGLVLESSERVHPVIAHLRNVDGNSVVFLQKLAYFPTPFWLWDDQICNFFVPNVVSDADERRLAEDMFRDQTNWRREGHAAHLRRELRYEIVRGSCAMTGPKDGLFAIRVGSWKRAIYCITTRPDIDVERYKTYWCSEEALHRIILDHIRGARRNMGCLLYSH